MLARESLLRVVEVQLGLPPLLGDRALMIRKRLQPSDLLVVEELGLRLLRRLVGRGIARERGVRDVLVDLLDRRRVAAGVVVRGLQRGECGLRRRGQVVLRVQRYDPRVSLLVELRELLSQSASTRFLSRSNSDVPKSGVPKFLTSQLTVRCVWFSFATCC